MNNSLTRLPALASDYSGACSVLFTLPSLNLLYSPGGCSSAVIECDEVRDLRQTLFFNSKLGELEVVMGAEEEFLVQAERLWANNKQAEFAAVIGTPVPALTGVDLEAIASRLSSRTGLPALALPTEGFATYYSGVYHTLLALGKRFLERRERKNKLVNILGYTPLSLGQATHLAELIDLLKQSGLEISCSPLEKTDLASFQQMSSAALSLVVSHEGLGLAQYLQEEYSVPYLMNVPVGLWGIGRLFQDLEEILDFPLSRPPDWLSRPGCAAKGGNHKGEKVVVLGEPLFASCLASCLHKDFGFAYVAAASLLKMDRRMSQVYRKKALSQVHLSACEEELALWIAGIGPDIIVGDPLYQRLPGCGGSRCLPLPHVGLSGSLYAKAYYAFIGRKGYDYLAGFIGE